MSWLERSLEDRLAEAARNGELDTPHLAGKPLPDLDRPRRDGWWAEQFVQRERSQDRAEAAQRALNQARQGFWRATNRTELADLVRAANAAISKENERMIPADRLELFDPADIERRWERLRR